MLSFIVVMLGKKLCTKCNLITVFSILANFAAFLGHTMENADVSNNVENLVKFQYFQHTKFGCSPSNKSRVRKGEFAPSGAKILYVR